MALRLVLLLFALLFARPLAAQPPAVQETRFSVPILLYHRFGPEVADGMTMRTSTFEWQMNHLKSEGYKIIPLRQLVNFYLKKVPPPPPRSVVITADDGHRSVYTDMFPILKKYGYHATLFIYPSAISNARYALTWEMLKEMAASGLVDIQSHSFWHPNLHKDRKRLSPAEFDKFVAVQFGKPIAILRKLTGAKADMLSWPFGIYDPELIVKAREAGYASAFTIERRHASDAEDIMLLPRYLLTDPDKGKAFERLLLRQREDGGRGPSTNGSNERLLPKIER